MRLVANARMYAITAEAREAWRALFAWVARESGVPLEVIDHPAPAPLDDLWRRPDLGLAFQCGLPFALESFPTQPVAAPVPAGAAGPLYATDFVVRADGPFRTLEDTFGGRIGWTVEHSQSGFNAPRHHLLGHRTPDRPRLFAASVGPLFTPRAVIDAVLDGRIDVGPLDSYIHALLKRGEPETEARLRTVATTRPTPMPLLIACEGVDPETVESLRAALVALSERGDGRGILASLGLGRFEAVERDDYWPLLDQAAKAEAAAYPKPE